MTILMPKHSLYTMWMNINIVPFQTVIALFCVLTGVFGLMNLGLNNDIFIRAIGPIWASVFNIAYIVAGAGMILGVALARKDIELFGLTVIASQLLIRAISMGWIAGLNRLIIVGYFFNALTIGACVVRAMTILRYKVIVQKIKDNGNVSHV